MVIFMVDVHGCSLWRDLCNVLYPLVTVTETWTHLLDERISYSWPRCTLDLPCWSHILFPVLQYSYSLTLYIIDEVKRLNHHCWSFLDQLCWQLDNCLIELHVLTLPPPWLTACHGHTFAVQSSLSVGLVRSIPAVCDSHMPPSQAFLQPYPCIYCTEVITSGLINTMATVASFWQNYHCGLKRTVALINS